MFAKNISQSTRENTTTNNEQNNPDKYQVKLVHATRQTSPEQPVQMAFSVHDENGEEYIVKCEDLDPYILFASTEEGQQWLRQQESSSSGRRSSRLSRVAG